MPNIFDKSKYNTDSYSNPYPYSGEEPDFGSGYGGLDPFYEQPASEAASMDAYASRLSPPNALTSAGNSDANSGKWDSAQQGMALQAAGAAGGIGASILTGYLQSKENEKNRAEARRIGAQNRADTLQQQGIENSFQTRALQNDEKEFKLKKIEDQFNLKYNRALVALKNSIESRSKFMQLSEQFASVMQNTDLQDLLASNFQGRRA